MSTKIATLIASVFTFGLVALVVLIAGFGGMVMLNGFMNADAAVYTGFTCLGITLILCPILAAQLTWLFITRFNWNNLLAITLSVLASTVVSAALGVITLFIVLIVAGG